MYSTDNGPHMNTWPDGGMTPFRNEKNSNWEGAYRVPAMVRWPGHIPAGQVLNGIVSHNDWFVTLLAAAGDTDVADRLKAGADLERDDVQGAPRRPQPARLHHRCGRREPATALLLRLRRRRPHGAALRQLEVRLPRAARPRARCGIWAEPFVELRVPEDLQPADRSLRAGRHHLEHLLRLDARPRLAGRSRPQAFVAQMLQTLGEFPPRQEPASFSVDKMLEKLQAGVPQRVSRRRVRGHRTPRGSRSRVACSPWAPTTTTRRRRPRHRVRVDAFAIDATQVTNAAVRRVRRGDRLPHRGRAPARSGGLSRRAAGEPGARLAGLHADLGPGRPAAPQPVVDLDARRLLVEPARGRAAR